MLIDFLEKNELDAELISFQNETNTEEALRELSIPRYNAVKVDYYLDGRGKGLLLIYPFGLHPDIPKVKTHFHFKELINPTDEQLFHAIGHKRGFVPPVSIYGVKVILDKSLESKKFLFCRVGQSKFLKISPEELVEVTDDYLSANIVKHK